MKQSVKAISILLLVNGLLIGKNLSITSVNFLDNFELLDVYIHNRLGTDYAFVTGGLGGLNIVDISNPSEVQVISEYFSYNCDFGRIYSWSTSENYAYGAGRECGLEVIDILNLDQPIHVRTMTELVNNEVVRYEHTEVQNDLLFASRHQHGVEIFDIHVPSTPNPLATVPTENAWSTLADGNYLYVADGSYGLKIIDISIPSNANVISAVPTSGTAKDIAKSGDFLFIAVGAAGADMFDVSDHNNPVLMSNYNTSGYASRIAVFDSIVAVSDWDDVEVMSFSSGNLELVGYKKTGGRVMALAMVNQFIYSAEWLKMIVFEYGQVETADIDFSTVNVSFSRVASGNSGTRGLVVENNGLSPLTIDGIVINSSDFLLQFNSDPIQPGESRTGIITYTPQSNQWQTQLEFHTNDRDEEIGKVKLTGNFPFGPMPGDSTPDFTLPVVNGAGNLSLSDLAGQPVVIAFFTGW